MCLELLPFKQFNWESIGQRPGKRVSGHRNGKELRMTEREKLKQELITEIVRMGYPQEFGAMLADSLGTEMTMARMLAYLRAASPGSAEEIADEMLAILSDRDRWQEKKINEYYNRKYNEYLWFYRNEDSE